MTDLFATCTRWLALPLLAALGGCTITTLASLLPPVSPNPFDGAAATQWQLPLARVRRANTPPSFGPYLVSNLHRGWTDIRRTTTGPLYPGSTGSALLDLFARPHVENLTAEKQKSQFHFADDQNHHAEVYTTTQSLTQATALSPTLSEVQRVTETFAAIIVGPTIGEVSAWQLLWSTPDRTHPFDPAAEVGIVSDQTQVLLHLRLVPHPPLATPNGRRVPWPAVAGPGGIEVLCRAQRVGYLDYATAHPSVWLRDDLPPDLRFLTATTLSAVLLKNGW